MLRRTAFALLSALSLLASAAQAAEPRLEVMPFLGSVAQSAWQPFTVTVTNPTDAPAFSGEVRLQLWDQRNEYASDPGNWSRPIQLPPGGSTKVVITADIPTGMLPVARVNLVQGTGQASSVIASEKFDGLRIRPGNTIVVLNLSHNPDALSQIDNLETGFYVRGGALITPKFKTPPMGVNQMEATERDAAQARKNISSRVRVTPITPEELPADSLGLDSVTAIYTDSTTSLTSEQKRVLDNYASAGGLLITEAGDTESITSQGIGIRASLRPDNAASWKNAFHKRAGQKSFLNQLSLSDVVEIGDGNAPIPLGSLILFLGIYIVILVPVQYVVLKRLDRREWAWGVTPALAILFALAAYGFGQRGRSRESFLNVASVIEMESGHSTGRALTSVGLFSPDYRAYDLGVKSNGLTRLSNQGRNAESLVNGTPTLRNLSVPMWSIESAEALSEVTLGQGLDVKRDRNKVTLTNRTGQIIRSIRIGYEALDQLQPGETRTMSLPYHRGSSPLDVSTADRVAYRMSENLWSSSVSWTVAQERIVVTGWLDTSPVELELNGKSVSPKHQSTLLVVYTPLENPED